MNTQENSAHSYTEGSESNFKEYFKDIPKGKLDRHINFQDEQSKDELRKELRQSVPYKLFGNEKTDVIETWVNLDLSIDWFYSKLSQKEQEIDRLKKELEELKKIPNF